MPRFTQLIMVRLTEDQRRACEQRASVFGITLSAWIRMLILRQLTAEEKKEDDQ
jgi:hypothetical protein